MPPKSVNNASSIGIPLVACHASCPKLAMTYRRSSLKQTAEKFILKHSETRPTFGGHIRGNCTHKVKVDGPTVLLCLSATQHYCEVQYMIYGIVIFGVKQCKTNIIALITALKEK